MKVIILCLVIVSLAHSLRAEEDAIQDCLEKDSISCVQLSFYRKAKAFFDSPSIDLMAGISLIKSAESRQSKSLEDNTLEVETAKTVVDRSSKIQDYLTNQMKTFVQERSFNINFANTARSISEAIPDEVKAEMRGLVEEGRLKKKKLLRKLMPILMGLKVKFVALGVIALFGLLFVAKKALVVSFIALALSLFSGLSGLASKTGGGGGAGLLGGLGSLFGGGSSGIGGYSSGGAGWAGNGGWSSGGGGGGGWSGGNSGWDSHGSYSSPVAQSVAYSGHKQT